MARAVTSYWLVLPAVGVMVVPVVVADVNAVISPLTVKDVRVPTDVILGCALVVTVPAVVAVPALVAYVALATVPVTFAPVIDEIAAPLPNKLAVTLAAEMFPVTANDVNVPTDVIFGCALPVTVTAVVADPALPAVVAYVAFATVPVTFAPVIDEMAAPLPNKLAVTLAALIFPVTARLDNVPTDVMFGCALVVTVPAVVAEPAEVAYVALATVPVTFAPVTELIPEPLPNKLAVTFAAVTLPVTAREVNVPTLVMFGCALVYTVPATSALLTCPVTFPPAIDDNCEPLPI